MPRLVELNINLLQAKTRVRMSKKMGFNAHFTRTHGSFVYLFIDIAESRNRQPTG